MSFFCDFLNDLKIFDCENKIFVSLVFDIGVKISGNFKIDDMSDDKIVLKFKNIFVDVFGKNLQIISIAKGEVEISGKISGVCKHE